MSIERGYDAVDRLVGGRLEPIEFGDRDIEHEVAAQWIARQDRREGRTESESMILLQAFAHLPTPSMKPTVQSSMTTRPSTCMKIGR